MSARGKQAAAPETTLEQALERLEEISRRLEGSELELAESLELYEEGVRLLRVCEGLLGAAEERIQQMRPDGEGVRFDPLSERP